ncbi:hypothetical protein HZA38_02880 [Candidatus Peregrinibacteria bacterium]|nr:hypothetical protein [Candidatus Peregrinibacteria bacterium]
MTSSSSPSGYIVVISAVISAIIAGAIASTVLSLAVTANDTSMVIQKSAKAKALADACAETALWELSEDVNYAGNTILPIGGDSCEILPVLGDGNEDRTIQVIGTADDVVRKIEIDIAEVSPAMTIRSWQEVGGF